MEHHQNPTNIILIQKNTQSTINLYYIKKYINNQANEV
jgi:hypothetical protein